MANKESVVSNIPRNKSLKVDQYRKIRKVYQTIDYEGGRNKIPAFK